MHWIAPSEKDADNAALEKRLWDAGAKSEVRVPNCEVEVPAARQSEFVIRHWPRPPAEARFDYLLNRPEAENIGAKNSRSLTTP